MASFRAPELNRDGSFTWCNFEYRPTPSSGDGEDTCWILLRDGVKFLELGPGFELLKMEYSGICSTDLARHLSPTPLPLIVGHEALARDRRGRLVAPEINASHYGRGIQSTCAYCNPGPFFMHTQCAGSSGCLGIWTLPGVFAPYFLAPRHTLIPIPDTIPFRAAILSEPLAAALHSVEASPPKNGDKVVVLGPRRLGLLIVASLIYWRSVHKTEFTITAIARHQHLLDLCVALGCDHTINSAVQEVAHLQYDIVYDTTGKSSGFELALNLTRREVHLKSTSEAHANGIERLWEFVVDELSLFGTHLDGSTKSLAEIHKFLDFSWEGEPTRPNLNIYVSPNIAAEKMNMLQEISAAQKFHQMTIPEAAEIVAQGGPLNSSIPLFDLAIVSSVSELDPLFRPKEDSRFGIVRPRGAILLTLDENPSPRRKHVGSVTLNLSDSGRKYSTIVPPFAFGDKAMYHEAYLLQRHRKIKSINSYLSQPKALPALRALALTKGGFVSCQIRKLAWSRLLYIDRYNLTNYNKASRFDHPFVDQIQKDVDRALWNPAIHKSRTTKVVELSSMLNTILTKHQDLHYFQGYHDIATVFLLVCGPKLGMALLETLSTTKLRAWLSPTLQPIQSMLELLPVVLRHADPQVADFIEHAETPPYFALEWMLTWFSHTYDSISVLSRIFDVFIASDSTMPLYMCASFVIQLRERLLKTDCDRWIVHNFFTTSGKILQLDQEPFSHPILEEIISRAVEIHTALPPSSLKLPPETRKILQMENQLDDLAPTIRAPTATETATVAVGAVVLAFAIAVANAVLSSG
ncbi:threonine dehydrogenase [Pelomyxa schiedti]|nr:threonine dehydrogenase [Pelomyxa schiedti]